MLILRRIAIWATLVVMTTLPALLLVAAALSLGACEGPKAAPKKLNVPPLKCNIDPNKPGPLRRGGRAKVELEGDGVSIKVAKVNAWCGPLFNTDVPALNLHAGQGVLFETCLPDGIIQLSAFDRPAAGKQDLHGATQNAGVELLFNQNGGPSYSSHGKWGDSIVLSDDLWKANAELVLYDVATGAKVKASVEFDCSGFKTGAVHPRPQPGAGSSTQPDGSTGTPGTAPAPAPILPAPGGSPTAPAPK